MTTTKDILDWLHAKVFEAEKTLKAREQGAAAWRSGDDRSWKAASKMHPSTAGRPMKKADREKAANREEHIAHICRRDVGIYKVLIALVETE